MHVSSKSEQVRSLAHAHSSAVTALSIVVISSLAWLALNASDANASNVYVFDARLSEAPKATGQAWAPGAKLYWDAVASNFTTTATANTLCGRVGAAAASADTTGTVLFNSFEV